MLLTEQSFSQWSAKARKDVPVRHQATYGEDIRKEWMKQLSKNLVFNMHTHVCNFHAYKQAKQQRKCFQLLPLSQTPCMTLSK